MIIDDNLDMENIETPEIVTDEEDNSQETDATIDPKEKRHAEQMLGSKKEVERLENIVLKTAVNAAKLDGNSLVELYGSDPRLADKVSKEFGYSNYADFKNTFLGKTPEDDFDTRYAKKRGEEIHKEALEKASQIIERLPSDEQEEAQQYFDEITEGKTLTEKQAIKYAEMTTLFVNRDKLKGEKKNDVNVKYSTTSLSGSKKPEKSDMMEVVDFQTGKLILVPNLN